MYHEILFFSVQFIWVCRFVCALLLSLCLSSTVFLRMCIAVWHCRRLCTDVWQILTHTHTHAHTTPHIRTECTMLLAAFFYTPTLHHFGLPRMGRRLCAIVCVCVTQTKITINTMSMRVTPYTCNGIVLERAQVHNAIIIEGIMKERLKPHTHTHARTHMNQRANERSNDRANWMEIGKRGNAKVNTRTSIWRRKLIEFGFFASLVLFSCDDHQIHETQFSRMTISILQCANVDSLNDYMWSGQLFSLSLHYWASVRTRSISHIFRIIQCQRFCPVKCNETIWIWSESYVVWNLIISPKPNTC